MWETSKWFLLTLKEKLENNKNEIIQPYKIIQFAQEIVTVFAKKNQLSTIMEELKNLSLNDFINAWFEEYENIKTWIEGSKETIKVNWDTVTSQAKQLAIR